MAVDAKTLRRPDDVAAKRPPPEAVTAVSAKGGVVLGQKGSRSGEGDSEMTAARALSACLDLRGVLITGDAIHAQDDTAPIGAGPGRRRPAGAAGQSPGLVQLGGEVRSRPP